jgi:hypothetical protein
MPAQESTAVGAVFVDYTDGHAYEWPDDGTQMGVLKHTGDETVAFLSNIGELPMGDGWYPNSVIMHDMGGNVVYEAHSDTMVVLGTGLNEDGVFQWLLPAGTVTTAAPAGTTIETGDYKAYGWSYYGRSSRMDIWTATDDPVKGDDTYGNVYHPLVRTGCPVEDVYQPIKIRAVKGSKTTPADLVLDLIGTTAFPNCYAKGDEA